MHKLVWGQGKRRGRERGLGRGHLYPKPERILIHIPDGRRWFFGGEEGEKEGDLREWTKKRRRFTVLG